MILFLKLKYRPFIRLTLIMFSVSIMFTCSKKTSDQAAVNSIEPSKEVTTEVPDSLKPEVQNKVDPPAPQLIVSFERTPCFGTCPVFEVRLFSDGRVIYHGKKHVKKIGKFEARVDQAFIEKLMEEVDWKGFFTLEDQYPAQGNILSDFPSTHTFIAFEDRAKSIHNNYDSPLALQQLEAFLEKQFDELDWHPISSQGKRNY